MAGSNFRPAPLGSSRAWLAVELKELFWINSVTVHGHSNHVRLCAGATISVLLSADGTMYSGKNATNEAGDAPARDLVSGLSNARQAQCRQPLDRRCASLAGQTVSCSAAGRVIVVEQQDASAIHTRYSQLAVCEVTFSGVRYHAYQPEPSTVPKGTRSEQGHASEPQLLEHSPSSTGYQSGLVLDGNNRLHTAIAWKGLSVWKLAE